MNLRKVIRIASILFFILVVSAARERHLQAQVARPEWNIAQRITGIADDVQNFNLFPDRAGRVHLFWSQQDPEGEAIYYAYWDGSVWSTPNDILISPLGGESRFGGAVVDEKGIIHLVFFGGNILNGRIFYTSSHVANANIAFGWSAPQEIGRNASGTSQIAIDGNGRLQVLYSVYGLYTGVESTYSTDGGETWTDPAPIFRESNSTSFVENIEVATDDAGRIHAVWSVWETTGSSAAVYNTRLLPRLSIWETPWVVGQRDPGDYEADWPNIIAVGEDEIHVIWQDGGFPPFRASRRSNDGGETWTEQETIFDVVGENGTVADIAVDSNGQLYAVTHGRYGFPDTWHGIFSYMWDGEQWSEQRNTVVRGKKELEFDPTFPDLVVRLGNQLLVVYGNDPRIGIWYNYATLDAPFIEPVPYPEPELPVTEQADTTFTPEEVTPTLAPEPTPSFSTEQPQTPSSAEPIVMGSLSAVVLLTLIVTIYSRFVMQNPKS